MEAIKTDKATLRSFGLTMAVCFAVITLIIFLKHRNVHTLTSFLALFFLGAGILFPFLLKYLYIVWMKLAFVLGWFNTRLLLCLVFYLILTPIGLIMRLIKKDTLELAFDRSCDSYWKTKEKHPQATGNYEKQF